MLTYIRKRLNKDIKVQPQEENNESMTLRQDRGCIALLGYSLETMEAAKSLGYDFVCVVPPEFVEGLEKDNIRAVGWNFGKISNESYKLSEELQDMGVRMAIGLYEETVEWAGMVNSRLRDDPKLFNRSLLFRDKAMMKRKAQMSGIRVGVFEEVESKAEALKFFNKINEALTHIEGDVVDPVHLKPISAAGSIGHVMVHSKEDIETLEDKDFPCLAESHLDGKEFSVETFIHKGKIYFMNINEYVHLGYSQILPPTDELEAYRPAIRKAVEKLIKAFNIQYGIIHPEYFIDAEGDLNFGEVANRVPGGHIFELIEQAYGFNPYQGMLLCADPETDEATLNKFFPDEITGKQGHAGNLLVYPRKDRVQRLQVPEQLIKDPNFVKHDMFEPLVPKVQERVGFGNHYGKICFFGQDPKPIVKLLSEYEHYDFYV